MQVCLLQGGSSDEGGLPTLAEPIETIAKGYKNWRGSKRQKQFKSWIERQPKRAPIVQPLSCHQSRIYKFIVVTIFLSK